MRWGSVVGAQLNRWGIKSERLLSISTASCIRGREGRNVDVN